MTIWNLHLLNARHALTRQMAEIRTSARQAVALAGEHANVPDFDLVVRAQHDGGAVDWGVAGHVPAPGVIDVTLHPDRFEEDLLVRVLVRQMHRLLRHEGRLPPPSLGEALVGEGLAGHFVVQVLGGTPDPWDAARPGAGTLRQAANLWARHEVDLAEWFQGRGRIRKWTGYGIGHRLIAEHLAQNPDADAAMLACEPADSFRPALRRLLAAEGIEEPEDAEDTVATDGANGAAPGGVEALPEAEAQPSPPATDEDT
jgi:uncharacterized protein YjaZ